MKTLCKIASHWCPNQPEGTRKNSSGTAEMAWRVTYCGSMPETQKTNHI